MKIMGVYRFTLFITCCFLFFGRLGYGQKAPDISKSTFRNETYDKLNLVSCMKYGNTGKGKSQLQTSTAYDFNGTLTYVDTFIYDLSGRITLTQRIDYKYNGQQVEKYHIQISDGHTDTTAIQVYHFDDQNRLIRLDETNVYNRSTRSESYEYDAYGNCTLLTVALDGMAFKDYRYQMFYDEHGNLIRIMQGDEIIEENTYDASNRLIRRNSGNCTGQFIYEANGKLSFRKQQCAASLYSAGSCNDRMDAFIYDKNNRLSRYSVKCNDADQSIRIIGLNQQTRYKYDKNGLIKKFEIRSEGYQWNYYYKYKFSN